MSDLRTKLVIEAEDRASGTLEGVTEELQQVGDAAGEAAPAVDALADAVDGVAESEVGDVAAQIDAVADAAGNAAGEVEELAEATAEVGEQADAVARIQSQFTKLAGAMAGLFAASKLKDYAVDALQLADAYAQIEARMQLAVGASGNLGAAMERVRDTANDAGTSLDSTAELYGRIAQSTKDLGYSQEQVADLTDTISKSFAVSGTSAQAASGAITQLAQAFAAGALRGDEFNSVNEAAPELMEALAKGLKVSRGELRALAEEGALTTEAVLKALEAQRDGILTSFAQLPRSIDSAMQKLANSWQLFLGELNKTSDITGKIETVTAAIAEMISTVADNLDTVIKAANVVGQVVLANLGVKALAAVTAYAKGLLVSAKAAAAAAAASSAHAAALSRQASAAAAAAAASAAHTAAMNRQGAAAALSAAAAAKMSGAISAAAGAFVGVINGAQRAGAAVAGLVGRIGLLRAAFISTGVGALAVGLTELVSWLWRTRDTSQEAAKAIEGLVRVSDIGTPEGLKTFADELGKIGDAAGRAGEQLQAAFADRIKSMGAEELEALKKRIGETFAEGTEAAKDMEPVLAAIAARMADIEERAGWGKALVTDTEAARFALTELQKEFMALDGTARSTAKALEEAIGKMDFSTVDGISKMIDDLDLLQASALATGEQIDTALRKRLADMTGQELHDFQVMAEMAFAGVAGGAEKLAHVNEAVLAVSFERLGVNADAAMGRISERASEAISALGMIASSSATTSDALVAAAEGAYKLADSAQAIEEVDRAVQRLKDSGRLAADGITRLDEASKDAAKSLNGLGTAPQTALQKLGLTADDAREQIRKLSEQYKRLMAAGDVQGAAGVQQQILQLKDALKETGKAADETGGKTQTALQKLGLTADQAREKLRELKRQYEQLIAAGDTQGAAGVQQQMTQLRDAIKETGDAADKSGEQTKGAAAGNKALADSSKEAGEQQKRTTGFVLEADAAMKEFGRTTNDVASVAAWYASVIKMIKGHIGELSQSALAAVDAATAQATSFDGLARALGGVAKKAQELLAADLNFSGLTGQIEEARAAADRLNASAKEWEQIARFSGQFSGLDAYVASLQRVEAALQAAKVKQLEFDLQVEQFNDNVERGTLSLAAQEKQLRSLVAGAEMYGSQNLSSLRSALADVQSRMQSIEESSRSALASLNDELDRMRGNYIEIEKRRAAMQRQDLTAQRDEAKAAGNTEAVSNLNAALARLREVEALRVQEAKERLRAEKERADAERNRKSERPEQKTGGTAAPTINVNLPPAGPLGHDTAALEAFARQLRPVMNDLHRRGVL